jgi:hypothetical protein
VLQLLLRVLFELIRDVHEFRALQDLRIDDIGDGGLILAGKILIQKLCQAVGGNSVFARDGFGFGYVISFD